MQWVVLAWHGDTQLFTNVIAMTDPKDVLSQRPDIAEELSNADELCSCLSGSTYFHLRLRSGAD